MDTYTSLQSGASGSLRTANSALPHVFREVRLGVLLRADPTGMLFRATWNHEPVSVKVSSNGLSQSCSDLTLGIVMLHVFRQVCLGMLLCTAPRDMLFCGRPAGACLPPKEFWWLQNPL